jgi:low molecular weight phosphotyrosine protein phosphatase
VTPVKMPKSVLFVCLGNICRSPMAEMSFISIVRQNGLEEEWVIDSAGTAGYHIGDAPDDRSYETTKNHFGQHFPHEINFQSRQVKPNDFEKFDFIFCMDNSNLRDLKTVQVRAQKPTAILKLFGEFDPKGETIIEDPYYGGMDGFKKNLQQVIRCSHAFLQLVKENKI